MATIQVILEIPLKSSERVPSRQITRLQRDDPRVPGGSRRASSTMRSSASPSTTTSRRQRGEAKVINGVINAAAEIYPRKLFSAEKRV